MMWLEFALIGSAAGFLAGYLGIGGGLVMVPALAYLFRQDPATTEHAMHLAVATSLATMMITSLSSVVAHHRKKAVIWNLVGQYAPGLVIGAVAGALLAAALDGHQLTIVFATFALLAGIQLLLAKTPEQQKPLPGKISGFVVTTLIGGISSLVGIGGGSMTAPWLMWHGVRAQQAIATAAACGYPIAVAGTLSFIFTGQQLAEIPRTIGYVHLPAFLGIVLLSVVTAPLGAAAVHRTPPQTVKRIFGGFLLLIAVRMMF